MALTVGTAGHIDHGKTWLVRALTGKDTDRLPEERERGISIALGYAPLALPDGTQLSLVDVPGAEVVAVSARTGAGLDELREALARAAAAVARRTADAPVRLYVDRAFTIAGAGTVVTGTLRSGSIAAGDELRVEPSGLRTRARSVQVHDVPVQRADAGQRVAVNLPGISVPQLHRGDVLVEPGAYPVSWRLDVALEELEQVPAAVTVHIGTSDVAARVV